MKNSPLIYSLIFIALFAALTIGGCTKSRTITKHSAFSFSTEVDYINFVDKRLDALKTFKASGKLQISNSKKSDSATSAILIRRPDSVRLESYSAFGQAVFFFTSLKDTFAIFIPRENKYFWGANTIENIQKVLPLDVSIEEFSHYLVGSFIRNKDDNVVIKFLEDKNIYKLYYYGEQKTVLWLDPGSLTITRCAVYNADDDVRSIVTFADFSEIEGMMFPMSVSIKFPDIDARIEIDYGKVAVNDIIDDDMFTLEVPRKAKVINLNLQKVN